MKKRPEYVSIGIITRAHGVKGEVVVNAFSDEIEQFAKLKSISIRDQKGERNSFNIERARITTNRIIIKLENIDDRDAALALKGLYLDKHSSECEPLPENEYYIFDLIGLKVKTADDVWVGEIIDVLTLPANDVYVIQDSLNEYLIPAIKDVIKKVDLEHGYILIEPMDGLL
jgi:16S rRNA processing protein RimM